MTDPALVNSTLARALGHIQGKRYKAAETELKSRGGAALQHPLGQNMLGGLYREQGRLNEALTAFDDAVRIAPRLPEAHCNRGAVLHELGRHEDAIGAFDRALFERPAYPLAHFNRGKALRSLGRVESAIAAYTSALRLQPQFLDASLSRGHALLDAGRLEEALADFRRVLSRRNDDVAAHIGCAKALSRLHRRAAALAAIEAALAVAPRNVEALYLATELHRRSRNFEEALAAITSAVAAAPTSGHLHAFQAHILADLKRFDEAMLSAKEAVRLEPNNYEGYVALSVACFRAGRLGEELAALTEAEKLAATGDKFFYAKALALSELGDLKGSCSAYEQAISFNPDNASYHMGYGMMLLGRGDYEAGWKEYEWRRTGRRYEEAAPQWRGEDLVGRRLLVFSEQGLGDTIQFLRFLNMVDAQAARITLVAPPALAGLIEKAFPKIEVVQSRDLKAGFDFQISLMSLPHIFGTTPGTIPRNLPIFAAEPDLIEKWRGRIGREGFKVGIAWQGNPKFAIDHLRSIPLRFFAPLGEVPGVRLISIQAQNGLDQLGDLPPGMTVESLGDEVSNNPRGFHEIAGVMANLDLIITSDTGLAHFAGALNHRQWIALRDRPDWRWGYQGDRSPWYPEMRIFRQETRGDWADVFSRITEALAREARISPLC